MIARFVRLRAFVALVLSLAIAAPACGPGINNADLRLQAEDEGGTLGPGDVFTLTIIGEKDIPTEYQVRADGDVVLPYGKVKGVHVDGLEPEQIEDLIRKRLIEEKVLTDPIVIVRVRQYNSKQVTVLGQVSRPGRIPFGTGMTMIQAISQAGGFNAIARRGAVSLKRKEKKGDKTVTRVVSVNVEAMMDGSQPDLPLQAGDQIYVPERIF